MLKSLETPMQRKLFFTQQVTQASISDLTQKIIEINDNDEKLEQVTNIYGMHYERLPIEIYIDSYGGAVYPCFGLLSVIENSVTPIHTIVTGSAMSCGFLILLSGHLRFAYKLSTAMYHQVSSATGGKLKDMQEDLEETERLQQIINDHTFSKTNITQKKLDKNFNGKKNWFIAGEDLIKLGIVDKII